jgi:NAD(P)-dependent dehydrogenase (short-subunit alcohol dehydrogenase family)
MKLPMKPDLTNRVAVVTGGAGVLCSQFCRALAACGAKVAVLGRTADKVEALAAEIRAEGGEAMGLCADVTDREGLKAACAKLKSVWGPCEILVNGAGATGPTPLLTMNFSRWRPWTTPRKRAFSI